MMLILSRKVEEEVVISVPGVAPFTLKICRIDPREVRLGWDAPKDVKIHRKEIQDKINAGEPFVPKNQRPKTSVGSLISQARGESVLVGG